MRCCLYIIDDKLYEYIMYRQKLQIKYSGKAKKMLTNMDHGDRLYEYAAQLGISVSDDTTKTGEFD